MCQERWTGKRFKPTGFFRVEQIDGRWWFVTPEGHGFLSAGVNHIDYREDYSDDFVDFATDQLRGWGFNTIGWSQEVTGHDAESGFRQRRRGNREKSLSVEQITTCSTPGASL